MRRTRLDVQRTEPKAVDRIQQDIRLYISDEDTSFSTIYKATRRKQDDNYAKDNGAAKDVRNIEESFHQWHGDWRNGCDGLS